MTFEELKAKYGPTMTTDDLAELFHTSAANIRNHVWKGTYPIPTYRIVGRLIADTEDVFAAIENAKFPKKRNRKKVASLGG